MPNVDLWGEPDYDSAFQRNDDPGASFPDGQESIPARQDPTNHPPTGHPGDSDPNPPHVPPKPDEIPPGEK